MEDWERHEYDVQQLLGLASTIGSGNKWHDISDGTVKDQYSGPFLLMVDAKSTIKGSYSVNAKFMRSWVDKAVELGKRFALPIRFLKPNGHHEDYIVLTLDDFAELMQLAGVLEEES